MAIPPTSRLTSANSEFFIPSILYQYPATVSNKVPYSFVKILRPSPPNTVNVFVLFPNCGAILDDFSFESINNLVRIESHVYMNNSYNYSNFKINTL